MVFVKTRRGEVLFEIHFVVGACLLRLSAHNTLIELNYIAPHSKIETKNWKKTE